MIRVYLLGWLDTELTLRSIQLCGEPPWQMTKNGEGGTYVILFATSGETYSEARQDMLAGWKAYLPHVALKFDLVV